MATGQGSLEFAWKGVGELVHTYPWMKNCPVPWDPYKQGVLRGDQHNTYDCNFFGMNMMTSSLYLGALKACAEITEYLNEPETAREYQSLYENGRALCDSLLWNGEYYIQRVEVIDGVTVPEKYRNPQDAPGGAGIKYQYGDGCLSDQLLGQYLAYITGLGMLTDSLNVRTALNSIYTYNFQETFTHFENVQRVYALNKESGLTICSWPKGNRPDIPFPYADEVWSGIEYQVAASLIYAGEVEKGLQLVDAVRGRYRGYNRDPFAEIESGRYYARSLSAWALLTALSGYQYDAVQSRLTFHPRLAARPFHCFWSCAGGWGSMMLGSRNAVLSLQHGILDLRELQLPFSSIDAVALNGQPVEFHKTETGIQFASLSLSAGDSLRMTGMFE
ncbi:MAG: GH116 family glycosyl hydrolase [candidate division KSB1 bacterium]|nr:GH116 family glycosyl hydrolase [candidate division KSB1 bacterium]